MLRFYILILWMAILPQWQLLAQASNRTMAYPVPQGLNYTLYQAKESSDEDCISKDSVFNYADSLEYLGCLNYSYIDGFYPIGWSKEGSFAYVRYMDDGESITNYEIMVIDSPLQRDSSGGYPVGFMSSDRYDSMDDFWQVMGEPIEGLLNRHKIESKLKPFKKVQGFATQGSGYSVRLDVERKRYIKETLSYVNSYELKVNGTVIARYNYKGNERYNNIKIAGVLESPFSRKAILVLMREQYLGKKHINTVPKLILINW